jgi:hypothetical protein
MFCLFVNQLYEILIVLTVESRSGPNVFFLSFSCTFLYYTTSKHCLREYKLVPRLYAEHVQFSFLFHCLYCGLRFWHRLLIHIAACPVLLAATHATNS